MIIDSLQWIIETFFILGHRNQGRGELGSWMHPVRFFSRILSKRFWTKAACLVLLPCRNCVSGRLFIVETLLCPPPKSTFEFIYSEANPQFIWHFPHRWIKALFWRLFESHFKTSRRELTLFWRPANRSEKTAFFTNSSSLLQPLH